MLGVVANTEGKKLHHLAREILVGFALHVLLIVKPKDHRGILTNLAQHGFEISGGVAAKDLVLLPHYAWRIDLLGAGGEMVMPEQRHALLERPTGLQKAYGPPCDQAAHIDLPLLVRKFGGRNIKAFLDLVVVK